ncbi:hypothetical protein [Planctomycetes bacterium K23_9]|uniref:Uncharacterized protein n=1 Tax=Stieleria marina TaxID=1930275 RepID=A0A517NZA9_9BACT|nr:hypothetical protein K239x_44580 [Planctomycetes bacterium K23_9]
MSNTPKHSAAGSAPAAASISDSDSNPLTNPHDSFRPTAEPSHTALKPTGVTVAGVISLLAGMSGILIGVMVIVQVLFGQQISDALMPAGAQAQAQRDMNAAMAAINAKYIIPHVLSSLGGLAISTCLIIGGIGCLASKSWTPRWMGKTLLALLVYEVLRTIFYVALQFETIPLVQLHMDNIADANSGNGGPPAAMVQSIQKISMIIGFAFWATWFVVKCGIAIWGRRYFGRDYVRDYFKTNSN